MSSWQQILIDHHDDILHLANTMALIGLGIVGGVTGHKLVKNTRAQCPRCNHTFHTKR